MKWSRSRWMLLARVGLAAVCLVLVAASIAMVRNWLKPAKAEGGPDGHPRPQLRSELAIFLPPETVESLGIRTLAAQLPSRPREIPPLIGSLALDPARLGRANARFAGEVMEIAGVPTDAMA